MENRRLLLAMLLAMGVYLLWGYLFAPEPPAPGAAVQEATPIREAPAPPLRTEEPTGGEAAPAEAADGEAQQVPEGERTEASSEERPVLDGETFRAEFTNRGGQLVSFRLAEHRSSAGEPVDLVRSRAEGPYPFALMGPGGAPLPVNGALFAVERGHGDRPSLTFRYAGPLGRASKTFTLLGEGLFQVDVEVPGRSDWGLLLGPGLRNPSDIETRGRLARHSAVYRLAGDLKRVSPKKAPGDPIPGGGLGWVGLEDQYFITAVFPESGLRQVEVDAVLVEPRSEGGPAVFEGIREGSELSDEEKKLGRELMLRIEPIGDRLTATTYWGAKDYDRLVALPGDLEDTMGLGWFSFLSRPLMLGLEWIHDHVVANYGWSIVLMTVFIKLLLLPLTHKSYVSMRKMQELNPRMQAIRQRWAGKLKDKQGRPNLESQRKMNEEIQALFRQEGVNPAGGCLPMLLQLPVLFAFYRLLGTWVELRGAPWMLWVQDLSLPDPHYVLPIIMGGTQFLQTWLTPTTGSPVQRKVMMLMPAFFTVLFIGFPTGLVLYWLTNNVLTIAQQSIYNHLKQRQSGASASKQGKGSKKR